MRTPAVILYLLLCALGGCANTSVAQRASISQSHLDQIDHLITDAGAHLDAARRLAPGDAQFASDLTGGARSLSAAHNLVPLLHQDINALSDAAASLQKQIDSHRNDLLGPRGKRIRDRLVIFGVLLGLGAALLRLGPLLGGPRGGGLIVAGHLLTLFAVPIIDGAWSLLRNLIASAITWPKRIFDFLDQLASSASSAVSGSTSAVSSPPTVASEGSANHAPVAAD